MNMDNSDILLVEDNDLDVQILKRVFTKLDFHPRMVRAKDGVEAVEILDRIEATGELSRPFLTLLDLNMPRMNGLEFLKELRGSDRYRDVPVFVLTTSSDTKDVAAAYRLNANGYLLKSESLAGASAMVETLIAFWRVCVAQSELVSA